MVHSLMRTVFRAFRYRFSLLAKKMAFCDHLKGFFEKILNSPQTSRIFLIRVVFDADSECFVIFEKSCPI